MWLGAFPPNAELFLLRALLSASDEIGAHHVLAVAVLSGSMMA